MEEQEAEFLKKQKDELENDGGLIQWDNLSCSSDDSYYKGAIETITVRESIIELFTAICI